MLFVIFFAGLSVILFALLVQSRAELLDCKQRLAHSECAREMKPDAAT